MIFLKYLEKLSADFSDFALNRFAVKSYPIKFPLIALKTQKNNVFCFKIVLAMNRQIRANNAVRAM